MIRNKTARTLSLYFGAALLAFALIIGTVFMLLFRGQVVQMHKADMEARALGMADRLSAYMQGGRGGGHGNYLNYINEIAGADAWVVDKDMNLVTFGGHGHMGGQRITNADLPDNAESIIQKVLSDQTVFSEDFSVLLNQPTLTVGVPIKSSQGQVLGAVLLHSPVYGTSQAIKNGMGILFISLMVGLLLSLLLSLWFSKSFTDPIVSKQAQDALKMENIRRDFVANISHELKTPITVVRSSLEALTDKVVTEPEAVEEYHRQMLEETIYLQRLVGDLLDLSRLQNADFIVEAAELDSGQWIQDVLRSARQMGLEKNIQFTVDLDRSYRLYGDYGRLRQMLLIILDNAIKFSPVGGQVSLCWQQGYLRVCDQGPGVPPEELPYIFERFYKVNAQENKTGTGLGLAIAKQISQRHGIGLWAENREDGGACFVFDWNPIVQS